MRFLRVATQFDHTTFHWLQQRHFQNLLVPLARKISWSADGYFYTLFVLYLIFEQDLLLLKMVLSGLIVERLVYFFLKNTTRRNRPPIAIPGFQSIIQASDKFSFPSGHTSAAFLLATFASFYAPATAVILFPWALSVACSRVVLGVHFPTDTLAGATLGTSVALCVINYFG